ncbi:MAG: V-type ATP synthase subunit F [Candidatus Brocadiales bacterium]
MMHRAVVIGEREDILPFKMLGMELEYANSEKEFERVMETMAQDPGVSLIIVTEDIVAGQPEIVSAFREKVHVPIVVLPTHLGSKGTSMKEAGRMIRKAVGVDILAGGS